MKKFFITLIFTFIFSFSMAESPQKIDVEINKEKLLAGELQIFQYKFQVNKKRFKKRVIGVLLIDAPPAEVWKVLKDWTSMPGYVKNLIYYKKKHDYPYDHKKNISRSLIEGKIKVGLLKIRYTLDVEFDDAKYRQDWRTVSKQEIKNYNKKKIELSKNSIGIKNIHGFEYIEPFDNGRKTIFYYAPMVELSIAIPGSLERSISKKSLKGFMLGVKKRIELK